MTTARQSRFFLWMLLLGLGALGYLFLYMKADVAIPLQGLSMRGLGNMVIRADADASIKSVHITEGAHVTPGTPIISLNVVEIEAEMASLEQEVLGVKIMMQAKQALLATHEKEYQAVKAMVDRGLEPAGELRKAELSVNTAKAEIVESEVKIGVLQAQGLRLAAKASRYQVISPHAGTVLKLLKYSIGDVVKAGDPIA
jgi:biotin carboxyl carrier protein